METRLQTLRRIREKKINEEFEAIYSKEKKAYTIKTDLARKFKLAYITVHRITKLKQLELDGGILPVNFDEHSINPNWKKNDNKYDN